MPYMFNSYFSGISQRGARVPANDDTAKLYTLDEEAMGDIDDTDSLPVMPDAEKEADRAVVRDSRYSGNAGVDGVDWLVSLMTTVDKRIERIEEELRQIRILLTEKQRKNGRRGKKTSALLADIRRRFR